MDLPASVERISADSYGRAVLSERLFEEFEVDPLPAQVIEVSASGFVLSPSEAFKLNDLVRLELSDPGLKFLDGWPARVVTDDGPVARCRFLKKSRESLGTILKHVTPRISKDALKGRSRRQTVAQTP
jgi:hypothetical protein